MKKFFILLGNLCLTLIALAVSLLVLEWILKDKSSESDTPEKNIPLYITVNKPYLYGMNPDHKRTNSFGLRDDEFTLEKPQNTYRILVLGDSLPYGRVVDMKSTFPNQLEQRLQSAGKRVEVINAGVSGYSPYNELHYYLEEGRKFQPDLVILSFCMNDVANPRLHWGYTQEKITNIPDDAIPNLSYDRDVIQPLMKERDESLSRKLDGAKSFLTAAIHQTAVYQFIASRLDILFPNNAGKKLQTHLPDTTASIPTYITAEDNLSIEVLTHPDSPEWKWLTGIYSRIHDETRKDGVPLIIAIFPLAYQLDDGYPHFPQKLFAEYCTKEKMDCVDFLEPFRTAGKEKIFMLDKERGYDVWHLSKEGHTYTADMLYTHLQKSYHFH